MAGRAERAHGTDSASCIAKYDGLPENGKLIEEVRQKKSVSQVPVLGNFVSTLDGVVMDSPVLAASQFGDSVQKPKFTAKITLFDSHGDDNF